MFMDMKKYRYSTLLHRICNSKSDEKMLGYCPFISRSEKTQNLHENESLGENEENEIVLMAGQGVKLILKVITARSS